MRSFLPYGSSPPSYFSILTRVHHVPGCVDSPLTHKLDRHIYQMDGNLTRTPDRHVCHTEGKSLSSTFDLCLSSRLYAKVLKIIIF